MCRWGSCRAERWYLSGYHQVIVLQFDQGALAMSEQRSGRNCHGSYPQSTFPSLSYLTTEQCSLTLDQMLDDPSEILSKGLPWDSYSLRRLLLEISKSSNTFPPSSFCRTICTNRNAVALGGCADIFKAKLNGRIVALKRLRVFQHSNTRNAHGTYMVR